MAANWRLTLQRDLAKFFLSCSETVAWMFLSDCLPVIQQCSRAVLKKYTSAGDNLRRGRRGSLGEIILLGEKRYFVYRDLMRGMTAGVLWNADPVKDAFSRGVWKRFGMKHLCTKHFVWIFTESARGRFSLVV